MPNESLALYNCIAQETRKLFESFLETGFTEDQAIELVKSQYAFAIVNYQIEQKRIADKNEALRRLRRRVYQEEQK